MKYTIMTYNVAAGRTYFEYAETGKQPVNLEKSAEVVKNLKPDVCGLNEVDILTQRSGKVDQVAFYKEYLGMNGAFGKAIDHQGGEYGNAFLTRFPIIESEVIDIPDLVDIEHGHHRTILRVKVDVDGKLVTFLQLHAGLVEEEKIECIDTLCKVIDSLDTPIILMGDFNMEPDFPALAKIREKLVDTAPLLNGGDFITFGTYPGDRKLHIDYIFVSKDIKPLSLATFDTMASDHFPLIMEYEI